MMKGKDLTQGNIFSNMVKFCIPLLFTNLLNSIYSLVDGVWIGRLVGDNGLAAASNCWPIILIAYSILSGVTVTTSVLVSQHYSTENRDKIKTIINNMYVIALIFGILTSTTIILTENFWLNLFNTPLEIIEETKKYMTIYLVGEIFDFVAFTIIDGMRAIGNSKTPLIILAITEVINLILDPILITMGYGVEGAAMATAISMVVFLILSYLSVRNNELLRFDPKQIKFDKSFFKKVSILGIPIMIQQITSIFTIMLEVNISNSQGIIGASTYAIVSKYQSFIWVIGNTINELITVTVGQFVGKKEFNRLKDVMKNGFKLSIFPAVLSGVITIFFSREFVEIFTDNPDVIQTSIGYMHVVGIGYILIPICQLLYGFVVGIGNTKYTFLASIVASITEVIVIKLLIYKKINIFSSLGNGITAWYIVEILIFLVYYLSKHWNKQVKN